MPRRTDPHVKRWYRWILYVAVAVAGLLITQQLRMTRGPERKRSSGIEHYNWSEADVEARDGIAWSARVDSLAPGDVADAGADAALRTVHGRVVDEDSRPVEGALVYASGPGELFAPAGEGWATTLSGPDGTFDYPLDLNHQPERLELLSLAPGLAAGRATIAVADERTDPVLLVMRRGWSIRGKVTTAFGHPIPDAFLIASGPHGGALHVPNGRLPGARALQGGSVALTREDGSFEIGGLEDETYIVTPQKQGHVIPPGAKQFREIDPGGKREGVDFVLDPLVGAWVRFVDRETRLPVTQWGGYWIKKDRRTGRTINPWYATHNKKAWSGEHPWHPGEFRAVYTDPSLVPGQASETGVEVWVRKPGFEPTHANLKAVPVESWAAGQPTEIELDRLPGSRFGSLHLSIRNFPRPERPAFIPLSVRDATSDKRRTFSARWDAEASHYVADLIPEGSYRLNDFVEVEVVRIREGTTAEVRAAFPETPKSDLTIRLVDDRNRPVSFAAFGVWDESDRFVTSHEQRYGFWDGLESITGLAPGRYSLGIVKTGFEELHQQIELTNGNTTELTCVLRRK